jgi:DNA-binding NarL/FixJ family response regulator
MMWRMKAIKTILVAVGVGDDGAAVIDAHRGERLPSDRLAAVFDRPEDAVRAAAALCDGGGQIQVGVDVGEPAVAFEVAGRVSAAAEPGQALVTEAVVHLAGGAVAELLRPAGGVRVAELGRTVPVFAAGTPPDAVARREITVVIADDQELLRAGFRVIIDSEPDLRVVGEAADGWAAIDVVRRRRPDVVLMDIRMPGLDGLRAAEEILGSNEPTPALVMLTTFDVERYVYDALRLGASGFLLKDAPADRLLDAIRVAAAGDALLAPAITRRLVEQFSGAARPSARADREQLATLTARELDVLRLIARGLSNAEIAAELVLGENTVKTHVGRVFAKLDLRDRAQAVVVAYEAGLVVPFPRRTRSWHPAEKLERPTSTKGFPVSLSSLGAPAVVAGLCTLAAVVAVAPAFSQTAAPSAPRVVTYQEPSPKVAQDDIPPKASSKLSLGDRLAISGLLEDAAHHHLGTFGGTCTVVGRGASFETTPLLCQAAYRTAHGELDAIGMMTLSKTNLNIVGGSGAYAGVHGHVTSGKVAKGFQDADKLTIEG